MSNDPEEYSHIKGWGIDADPSNDPTYPMRKRSGPSHAFDHWVRPPQQEVDLEVHHSVERPGMTAVFGTAAPPSGLSGMIRRYAFTRTENEYSHWLPLLLADRVNVLEGILQDLSRGTIPNILAEKGLAADWKYDRPRLMKKAAIGALAAIVIYRRLSRRRR